jgi:hypothetical protein
MRFGRSAQPMKTATRSHDSWLLISPKKSCRSGTNTRETSVQSLLSKLRETLLTAIFPYKKWLLRGLLRGLRGLRRGLRGLRLLRVMLRRLRGLRVMLRGLRGLRVMLRRLRGLRVMLRRLRGLLRRLRRLRVMRGLRRKNK